MFKPLIHRVLQHLTAQNQWSRPHFLPYAGQIVQFNMLLAQGNLLILEDGSLSIAGETATPNATVHIPPSLAMRLLAKDEAAKMFIKIDGDMHLATEVSKVLQLMRWDIEEDMSKIVGDVAAFKIGEVSQKAFNQTKQHTILAEMLTEYWQEEKNILAKKRHVDAFNQSVDILRNDVERFEKRVEKLIASMPTKHKKTKASATSTPPESTDK